MVTVLPVVIPPGLANGKLTPCQLAAVYFPGHGYASLHPAAKRSWDLLATMCHVETGATLTVTSLADAYRSFANQEQVFYARTELGWIAGRRHYTYRGENRSLRSGVAGIALPGTSNHGWGLAVDVALWTGRATVSSAGNAAVWAWLQANAPLFGWTWEGNPDSTAFETWHMRHVTGDDVSQHCKDLEAFFAANL